MSISHKIRQTTSLSSVSKSLHKRETSVEEEQHYCDYYTFRDAPKKKKSKVHKKGSDKEIGSTHDHSQSLQKLQLAIENRNKQMVHLVQETSRLRGENELLKGKLLMGRNQEQKNYIKQLKELEEQLDKIRKEDETKDQKYKTKLQKLKDEKLNCQKIIKEFNRKPTKR